MSIYRRHTCNIANVIRHESMSIYTQYWRENATQQILKIIIKPLQCKGNYSALSNNMKLLHWLLMCRLLHLVQ